MVSLAVFLTLAAPRGDSLLLLYKLLAASVVLLALLIGIFVLAHRLFRRVPKREEGRGAAEPAPPSSDTSAFMMATFQGVIKRMREQEKELERLHRLERQRAEESEQLAATIMRNMATGLVMLNARGLITQSNPSAKSVLGHQLLIGRNCHEVFWPDYQPGQPPPVMENLAECLRTGSTFRRLQMTYRTPSSQNLVLGVGLSPIRTAEGAVAGAICLLTDLTEITALQQQVRLKENLAALGEMSAGIAHEFKNSLATISGYAQLTGSATLEEARDHAGRIVSETQFLSKIVTDFLNFSRPLSLVAEPVETRGLIENTFEEIKKRGDFAGITLALEGHFPVVEADPTLLRQAFSNLLRNGCEAVTERGGPEASGRLEVESRTEPGEGGPVVKLRFQDNGGGIARQDLEKVFIPFFTTKNAGTGLGLALVHKIVINHNGKIEVESEPGVGTTFTVTLPLAAG